MKRSTQTLLALACACAITPNLLFAQIIYTFDEYGTSSSSSSAPPMSPGIMQPDPSGGLTVPVLVYTVPLPLVTGDVVMTEPGNPAGGPDSDVVRFWNPTGINQTQIIFYSDFSPTDPPDAPADTGLPGQLLNPVIIIPEVGPEGNNGAVYTPPAAGPGALPGALIQYNIISDGRVPEPSTMALAGLGGLMLLALKRRHQIKN